MGDREYVDEKFAEWAKSAREDHKALVGNIKWFIGILVTVLILFGGGMLSNMRHINDNKFNIAILDARTEELKYKTGWLMELGELQRDFMKKYARNEDVSEQMDKFSDLQRRVMAGGNPMPTLRGQ